MYLKLKGLKFHSLFFLFKFLNFICDFFCTYRLFDILEPGMCHFIDHKADLSSALPSIDAFHLTYEVIRGDRQHLKSNFL